jgi:hypothetical protein
VPICTGDDLVVPPPSAPLVLVPQVNKAASDLIAADALEKEEPAVATAVQELVPI